MSYQLSELFIHSLIIIATNTKAESHRTRTVLSVVKADITPERFPRSLLFAAADPILVTHQPVSVGSRGRSTVAVVAGARGINDPEDAATLILIHPIGIAPIGHSTSKWWRSDAECGKKSPGRSECKCRVMNRRDKASRGKEKWTEAGGRGRRGRRSSARELFGRSGENPGEAREGSPDWPGNGREFEAIMFGRGVFLKGENSDSIVIDAPSHVSNFSQVLKKSTV
jgi:hypothetical protein